MGGMVALAYALQYPDECDYLICISAATRALPFTIAMRSLQREILRCDPKWKDGHYHSDEEPVDGMKLARKLGLVSYRAAEEWHQRFDRARVSKERRTGAPFDIETVPVSARRRRNVPVKRNGGQKGFARFFRRVDAE